MKEINIHKIIADKRKEKGITQEELAAYIGITKASVSKWETGQSYPDITFLPLLASYFNISIDELISYTPQMEQEDIKNLYHRLAEAFSEKPFNEVMMECRGIIKKYYSCFPLLIQMGLLFINHHMLAEDMDRRIEILEEAIHLFSRVQEESDDVSLAKEAVSFKSTCYLLLSKPNEVLQLLGETIRPNFPEEDLIAQAYQMLGNTEKANEMMQISMYQHLIQFVATIPNYVLVNASNTEKVKIILNRAFKLVDIYEIEKLHPNMTLKVYYAAAQVYCIQENFEGALEMLRKYVAVCAVSFTVSSLHLHGDSYFDVIDGWFAEFPLGAKTVRSEDIIKQSMLQNIAENPVFVPMKDVREYKNIIASLKFKLDITD
ncbi:MULTISPECIES: helix-turn-helix transcriptional regulator [Bacillus]|uniref:helix-turn-helix domain-containing protein n=1 Tax=Bacillus TaxID=1386 RepID=UPI0018F72E63|nr:MULTISPECIES: helix-turn-helix transcriptional regulator [Bacillus]HDR7436379.1 helix-turn-helix transcriptional regulator [Bacillus anthracis]MBJ8060079.1 helix-turn-helix transcriptional regulator [Bacillus cereus]MCU4756202.1 helix-turn-helix domain-containing protein [Bacillus cereus]MCU5106184.1 helix-turn-helix domain-containing protein [Bacillus cereus]MCU5338537.1 helix-turn-helix domain-containing protein [Bacillus cereus]